MSRFLNKIEIEVENVESKEVVFSGSYEDFLEINDFDDELEEILNNLQKDKNNKEINFYGTDSNEYLIKKINIFE